MSHAATPSPFLIARVRVHLVGIADTGVVALALTMALGVVLDAIRPGSAVHPRFLGSTGVQTLDTVIASAFVVLVLGRSLCLSRCPRTTRIASALIGAIAIGLAGRSLGRHARALIDGDLVATGWAPPLTLVALVLIIPFAIGAVWGRATTSPSPRLAWRRWSKVAVAGFALVALQLAAYGATDYRGRADAILVLGSKVHADGTPSGSLVDRTRTACALWRDGLSPLLVFSGGRDPKATASEPEAMRVIARGEGVPDEAVILDETGVDTASSMRFAARLARERGLARFLVVSHDYHLARVRLLADREGLDVRTVSAVETCPSGWKAFAVGREIAAYAATWALIN